MIRIAALVALAWASTVHAAVWHVPLERHERAVDSSVPPKKASVWDPVVAPQNLLEEKRHHVPVDFRDVSMNLFAAKIFVGTPPQPVSLGLELSSSDLLVINHRVGHHTYYDHTKSTSYEANGTQIKYFEGMPFELDGFVSRDHVTLGGAHGGEHVAVRDQAFVELTGLDKVLNNYPPKLDGFVGLGPGRANTTGAPSIVRAMVDQQLLDRPVVGLGFDDVVAHVIFGDVNESYTSNDFHFFEQKQRSSWGFPLSGFVVDGKRIVHDAGFALVEVMDLMMGPRDLVDALAEAVGAENYALSCDGPAPDITIQLGDALQVTLTKDDYAIPQGQGWCMFGILGSNRSEWAFGLPLLRKVYTVLDFGSSENDERIGFASLKP